MKYEPAYDGLRAIAITSVFIYHLSATRLPGGWVGVDIFFVLSGYLITSILMREFDNTGVINLKKFYLKRALRLAPALALMLIAVSIYSLIFTRRAEIVEQLRPVFLSGLYLMNWNRAYAWFPQGVLGHTWSLAMEEQFYVLWPFLLPFMVRHRPLAWIGAMIAAVIAWRIFLASQGASVGRLYNGFDTHSDGLFIGCLIALTPNKQRLSSIASKTSVVPIILLALMLATMEYKWLATQAVGLTVSALLAAWLILAIAQGGRLRSALSW